MKVSDILTLVAVLAGGTAIYFAYDSWEKYAGTPFDEAARKPSRFRYVPSAESRAPLIPTRINREENLEQQQGVLDEKIEELAGLTKSRDETLASNKQLQDEILEATTEKQDFTETIRRKRNEINENSERIRELEEALAAAGNPDELKRDVEDNIRRLRAAEQALLVEKQNLEEALNRKANTESLLADAKEVERKQTAGEMDPGFRSSIRQVFDKWGFFTINGGSRSGVNARTKLWVVRDGMRIAQAVITTVEPTVAVCTIIDGSVVRGTTLVPGDRVMPAPVEAGDAPAATAATN